ncbi:MAG: inositol monophosphatase family protein [Rhodothalassiaceae bacterium]
MPEGFKSDDFALLVDAVRGAGAIALHYFNRKLRVWEKAKNNPVTEADIAVNRYLKARLEAARPDYGWLSEENEDDPRRLTKERVWVVDPIDGTRAFMKGTADFAISVALVEAGRPRLGVVYRPLRQDLYAAASGCGARLNGEPIHPSDRTVLDDSRLAGDPGYFRSKKIWPLAWPATRCRNWNSIALRVCFVASGRVDAAVTLQPKQDWDMAAADLILTEAGGRFDSGEAGPHAYNGPIPRLPRIIATNGPLHAAVMERVQAAVDKAAMVA